MRESDLHRSVNDRIRLAAAAQRTDVNRLRRNFVFHRLLARLAPHELVLKGGFCLEARLPGLARATKDVDLVGLITARQLRAEEAEQHAWRVDVLARLGSTEFQWIKLDLVGQTAEMAGATEKITIVVPVSIPGLTEVVIEAVDVYQHAAEKIHAYARIYARERPSSRVKDLIDRVLLIESELLVDRGRLRDRLVVVYAQRDRDRPGPALAQPPQDWARPYAAMAS